MYLMHVRIAFGWKPMSAAYSNLITEQQKLNSIYYIHTYSFRFEILSLTFQVFYPSTGLILTDN